MSDCENSEDVLDSSGGPSFNETDELGGALEEEESDDGEEAFNDLEEETMLCADYVPQTRNKRLPDAIIIGARKVNKCKWHKKLNCFSSDKNVKRSLD